MNGASVASIEVQTWAVPAEGMTLDELVLSLRAVGNPVLEVDRDHNRVLMVHSTTRAPWPTS